MQETRKEKCPCCGEEIDGLHNCSKSPRRGSIGWQCPGCGTNYSVHVLKCECTKLDMSTTADNDHLSPLLYTPPMSWIEGGMNGGKVA